MSIYVNSFRRRFSKETESTETSSEKKEQTEQQKQENKPNENDSKEIITGKDNQNDAGDSTSVISRPQSILSDEGIERKESISNTSSNDSVPKQSKMSIYMNSFRRRFSKDKTPDVEVDTTVKTSDPGKEDTIASSLSDGLSGSSTNVNTAATLSESEKTKEITGTTSSSLKTTTTTPSQPPQIPEEQEQQQQQQQQ